MPVPYLGRAIRGWTKKINIAIVTKTVVNHQVVESETPISNVSMNLQPMPTQVVNRKPEEQRSWSWWSIILDKPFKVDLKIDDRIIVNNIKYRIMTKDNWESSGFRKHEAIEDYT